MDLTDGLKLSYLREGNEAGREIAEFFYQKAYNTNDCDEKERYANRALFKSSAIALQEFLKFHQKEVRSGTFSRESGMAIAVVNRGDLGISSSQLFSTELFYQSLEERSSSSNIEGFNYTMLGTNDSSYKFLSEFPESRNPETILELYSFLRNLVNNKSDKLFVAFLVFNSEYDRWLTEVQAEYFTKEFDFFDKIKTNNGKVNYCSLWNEGDNQLKFLGYKLTQYKIRIAKTDILKRARQLQIKQSIF